MFNCGPFKVNVNKLSKEKRYDTAKYDTYSTRYNDNVLQTLKVNRSKKVRNCRECGEKLPVTRYFHCKFCLDILEGLGSF